MNNDVYQQTYKLMAKREILSYFIKNREKLIAYVKKRYSHLLKEKKMEVVIKLQFLTETAQLVIQRDNQEVDINDAINMYNTINKKIENLMHTKVVFNEVQE